MRLFLFCQIAHNFCWASNFCRLTGSFSEENRYKIHLLKQIFAQAIYWGLASEAQGTVVYVL